MTEVDHGGRLTILQQKGAQCSSIVTSRKRKLRELYAVATHADTLPSIDLSDPNANFSTTTETKFLNACDLSHGRIFDPRTIPSRQAPPVGHGSPYRPSSAGARDRPSSRSAQKLNATSTDATRQYGIDATKPRPLQGEIGLLDRTSATLMKSVPPSRATHVPRDTATDRLARNSVASGALKDDAVVIAQGLQRDCINGEAQRQVAQAFDNGINGMDALAGQRRQHIDPSASDAMDLDPGEMGNGVSHLDVGHDQNRAMDAASSPGSTAHTGTTPALHDASTDTSPDHEMTQHAEEIVVNTFAKRDAHGQDPSTQSTPPPSDPSDPQTQLLRESAEASGLNLGDQQRPSASRPLVSTPSRRQSHLPMPRPSQESVAATAARRPSDARIPSGFGHGHSLSVGTSHAGERTPVEMLESPALSEGNRSPASAHAARLRRLSGPDNGHRRRSNQAPTVVFGKQPAKSKEVACAQPESRPGALPTDDYFTTLFFDGFTRQHKSVKSIELLLSHAHKVLSTPDCSIALRDNQACKILRRVYHLQQHDKWSLRQLKRCPEPTRQPTHQDLLMQEMKWMRTDFREERKWKRAMAKNLAEACATFVAANAEDRKSMQVAVDQSSLATKTDTGAPEVPSQLEEHYLLTPVPDLTAPEDAHSPIEVDEPPEISIDTIAPSAIFTLPDDEVVFRLERSAAADRLLEELPLYGAPLTVPKTDALQPDWDPDARWRRPALALSKFVQGDLVLDAARPPKMSGRFDTLLEDDSEDDGTHVARAQQARPPASTDCALFTPSMKSIRDRLHVGHQFRPPGEFPMPTQPFYEGRTASQWTEAEDDELKALVREYSYNWSLISDMLSTKSAFTSGPERRTHWECFERWVQMEGLPNDHSRTPYFQMFQRRIENAQRTIAQHNINAQQQVGPNGVVTPRRRPTVSVRVEKRRNQKHLAVMDGMRKLAKKRETQLAKQQHAATLQANRKPTGDAVVQTKQPVRTPRDYSILRHQRDQQMAEEVAKLAQAQQEQQRKQAAQARGHTATAQMGPAGAAGPMAQVNGQVNGNVPNAQVIAAARAQAAQMRHAAAIAASQGQRINPQTAQSIVANMQAQAQAQAQMGGRLQAPLNPAQQQQLAAALQNSQRMQQMQGGANNTANLIMQAQMVQDQQRQALQQQQQVSPPHGQQQQHNVGQRPLSSGQNMQMLQQNQVAARAQMNRVNGQNYMTNGNSGMMAPFHPNANGISPGSAAGLMNGNAAMAAGSPRAFQALSSHNSSRIPPVIEAQITDVANAMRAKNPSLPEPQLRAMAMHQVRQAQILASQNAMQAAAGTGGGSPAALSQQLQAQAQSQSQAQVQQNSPGMAAATMNGMQQTAQNPHQYAHQLRAQQQAQQASMQQQVNGVGGGQQRVASQQSPHQQQHPRPSSGGASSTGGS